MSLTLTQRGCLTLQTSAITFDNAMAVAADGQKALATCIADSSVSACNIDLSRLQCADSSALSVFLSWLRFAAEKHITLRFSHMPSQLEALANVCGVYALIMQPKRSTSE